jgi:hypothetical protein
MDRNDYGDGTLSFEEKWRLGGLCNNAETICREKMGIFTT